MSSISHTPVSYTAVSNKNPWKPGVWRRIPWSGLSCVGGAVVAFLAAVAILVQSNGALISSWRYPPTVYISISYTMGNILLNAALPQGVTVCLGSASHIELLKMSD